MLSIYRKKKTNYFNSKSIVLPASNMLLRLKIESMNISKFFSMLRKVYEKYILKKKKKLDKDFDFYMWCILNYNQLLAHGDFSVTFESQKSV